MSSYSESSAPKFPVLSVISLCLFVLLFVVGLGMVGCPSYSRYQNRQDQDLARQQARMNAENQTQINAIQIQQTEQLVQVEKQKAQIRIIDAQGIAEAQRIINATLTDKYLQHEAISAQSSMANSPNHTTIYIPSGQNGIPLVRTVDEKPESASPAPEKK